MEVLGNIFLEYYYDEEVQQNSGFFIGANWERWARSGAAVPSVANFTGRCGDRDSCTEAEHRLGHPGATLGLVCHSWRKVFLDTPQLWSSIRIWLNLPYSFYDVHNIPESRWHRRERDMNAITRQIDLHLRRSRAVPLSIEIHTNCFHTNTLLGGGSATGETVSRVLNVFGRDMWRIHGLVVKRTDHAREQLPVEKLPPPISPGVTGLATPPYSASPRSPDRTFPSFITDTGASGALEAFIIKLDGLRSLTLANWTQNTILDITDPDGGVVLPSLNHLTLLSCSPIFCCNGIPLSQLNRFTSYNCKYNYGQLLDLLEAMPMLTHLDVKMNYNEPGVSPSPYPSPRSSPLPSPISSHGRHQGGFFANLDVESSAAPRRRTHIQLPFLTHMNLQGLLKSVQLLLCALRAQRLTDLRLNTYDAGIGVTQSLSEQCPCESLFRFLRRSQCSLESLRADTMFLVPPQPSHYGGHDPRYIYSYMLRPDFVPLQALKTLIIGRGHPDIVERLLLTLAWRGDPELSDVFPHLDVLGCEMKLGHAEVKALAGLVMSRIPSGVVFTSQFPLYDRRGGLDSNNARLWPIFPQSSAFQECHGYHVLDQQLKKYPTRLRVLTAPSAKSNINVTLRQHFRSWFPDFPYDSEPFLPQTFC